MTKFETIMQFAVENGGTFTSKDANRLIGHTYYCNGSKHVSEMLSRHVKNGTIKRLHKGVFALNSFRDLRGNKEPVNPNQVTLL